ncbi:hypothetical protein E2C01_005984 [Portunus trituberculatus]|uniref:Uncharacterized protein n=1 Tax=Portunus trituberculatus TaxID=210409 RepID=A0A5B7CVP5_PORTR|nr:hypothetical protein [Portunus trituberculatus]
MSIPSCWQNIAQNIDNSGQAGMPSLPPPLPPPPVGSYNTTVPIPRHHRGVTVMQVLAVREEAAGGGHALELL